MFLSVALKLSAFLVSLFYFYFVSNSCFVLHLYYWNLTVIKNKLGLIRWQLWPSFAKPVLFVWALSVETCFIVEYLQSGYDLTFKEKWQKILIHQSKKFPTHGRFCAHTINTKLVPYKRSRRVRFTQVTSGSDTSPAAGFILTKVLLWERSCETPPAFSSQQSAAHERSRMTDLE